MPFGIHTSACPPRRRSTPLSVAGPCAGWTSGQGEQPLFLWVSFCNPHFPFDPPEPYDTLYDPAEVPLPVWREGEMEHKPTQRQLQQERGYDQVTEAQLRKMVANYYGNISLVDDQVGRVLDVLAQKGLDENTLIAFTSDHGDHLGDHRLLLKSGVTFYDACVRVPFLIRYPAAFPPGAVCDELVESIDLAPTLLDVAGVPVPETMQGRSLVGLAEGEIEDWRDDAFSEIDLHSIPACTGRTIRARATTWPWSARGAGNTCISPTWASASCTTLSAIRTSWTTCSTTRPTPARWPRCDCGCSTAL